MKLFARYAELVGAEEVEVAVALPTTVEKIVAALKDQYPAARAIPEHPLVAVNLQQAGAGTEIAGDEEVALLPPVAGG